MKLVVDLFGVVMEVLMLVYLLNAFFGKPTIKPVLVAGVYILVGIAFWAISTQCTIAYQRSAAYLMIVLVPTFCYKGKIATQLLVIILYQVIQIGVENLVHSGLMVLKGEVFLTDASISLEIYTLGLSISKFISMIFTRLLVACQYNFANQQIRMPKSWFLILLGLPLSTVFVLYMIFDLIMRIGEVQLFNSYLIAMFFLFASNLLIFDLIDQMAKYQQMKRNVVLAQEQIISQQHYYSAMTEKNDQLSRWAHDMKNYMQALTVYLHNNQNQEVISYLETMGVHLSQQSLSNTGHPTLDAMLTAKIAHSQQQQTVLIATVLAQDDLYVEMMDLALMVANGLDNALEATARIADPTKRQIWFSLITEGQRLRVSIKNTVPQCPKIHANRLATTKQDKAAHGYGLGNIATLAQQYGGEYFLSCDDHIFELVIVLKNMPQSRS